MTSRSSAFLLCPLVLYAAWPKFLLPATGLYAMDYGSRIAVIALFLALGGPHQPSPAVQSPAVQSSVLRQGAVTIATAVGLLIIFWSRDLFITLGPWAVTATFPPIADPTLRWLDLTVGLALVAVSEEIAFRRVGALLWPESPWTQAVLFGLLHAPQGVVPVIGGVLAGGLLMWSYRTTGRLLVPITLHYALDLWLFA